MKENMSSVRAYGLYLERLILNLYIELKIFYEL